MNNMDYPKTMKHVRKNRDLNLVSTKKKISK